MKKVSFSNMILTCITVSYFIGLVVGSYAILKILTSYPEYAIQGLIAYFTYIGSAIGITIGFNQWKAKSENLLKIPHYQQQELEKLKEEIDD